jgi:hypothetical protein
MNFTDRQPGWRLRQSPNFLSRIKVIWVVQPLLQKYSDFPKSQISL